jgi:hypothetical protein
LTDVFNVGLVAIFRQSFSFLEPIPQLLTSRAKKELLLERENILATLLPPSSAAGVLAATGLFGLLWFCRLLRGGAWGRVLTPAIRFLPARGAARDGIAAGRREPPFTDGATKTLGFGHDPS